MAIVIAFLVALYFRKIEDFYLNATIAFLVTTMVIRVFMCGIIMLLIHLSKSNNNSEELLQMKVQFFQFTLPYYLFLMVTNSLLFSAFTFYKGIRNMCFPQLEQKDKVKARKL